MTEPAAEPEPVDPGEDAGVDPPRDDDTSDENALESTRVVDVPDWREPPDYSWIASDVE